MPPVGCSSVGASWKDAELYDGKRMAQVSRVTPIPLVCLRSQHAQVAKAVEVAIARVSAAQQFILGEEVRAFEDALAARFGVAAAVGVASGSDALYLALRASGVGPGDEVITTALSFFATAGAIVRTGATPVFVDVESEGLGLDPARLDGAFSSRTKAIVPVHLYGRCARIEPVVAFAASRGIAVIEDVAQAIDATRGGHFAGTFGDFGCLSFHPTKNLGGWGDGGMVLCRDGAAARVLGTLRAHGGRDGVYREVGINSRLDALQAAILGAKLPYLEGWNAARRSCAQRYRELFAEAAFGSHLTALAPDREGCEVVHHFVVRCRRRDALRAHLDARGIGVGIYYPTPLHLQPCFASLGGREGDCPVAEAACVELLSLPMFPELAEAQQRRVVDEISSFYKGSAA
jgi:dTDP-4-amino-4,6-dideoxygalactose transaminase